MKQIIDEDIEKTMKGNVLNRLMRYAKPYWKCIMFVFLLVLAITGFELLRPVLVGDAIDSYIDGYDKPYIQVNKEAPGAVEYNGVYLSKNGTADSYYQLFLYKDKYYMFEKIDANEQKKLQIGRAHV